MSRTTGSFDVQAGQPNIATDLDSNREHVSIDTSLKTTTPHELQNEVKVEGAEQGRQVDKYILPNDENEHERLDLQHTLWLITLDGKLSLAPIEDPQYVLDIGTGTGIWAVNFAKKHPSAQVIGTDLNPPPPTTKLSNLSFQTHDAESSLWAFPPLSYIHGRFLLTCFANPLSILRNSFSALHPGGYLELQDGIFPLSFLDPQPSPSHPLVQYMHYTLEASRKMGRPWDNVRFYAEWMREVGFVDVVERRFEWPLGLWAEGEKMKRLGQGFEEDVKGVVGKVCWGMYGRVLGWSEDEIGKFVRRVQEVISEGGVRAYFTV